MSRNTENVSKQFNISGINWTAGLDEVPNNVSGSTIINCLLPKSKKQARAAIDAAKRMLSAGGNYVHISSIAVNSIHSGYPAHLVFAGDGYIRIKKFELSYLAKYFSESNIVYPGIVCGGNTSWDRVFSELEQASTIISGADLNNPAPIADLQTVGKLLAEFSNFEEVSNNLYIPEKVNYSRQSWKDIVGNKVFLSPKKYIFSPSILKEWILILATSKLTPDFIWDLATLLRERKLSHVPSNKKRTLQNIQILEAMTNFYMTCQYSDDRG